MIRCDDHDEAFTPFCSAVEKPKYCKEMLLFLQAGGPQPVLHTMSLRHLLYQLGDGPKPFSRLWLDVTELADAGGLQLEDAGKVIGPIVGKLDSFTFEIGAGELACTVRGTGLARGQLIGLILIAVAPRAIHFFESIMSCSAGLKELRIRGDFLIFIRDLLRQVPKNDLRTIHLDFLGNITGSWHEEFAFDHLRLAARHLPPSLERLDLNWVQPKMSNTHPSPAVAQHFLARCDGLGVALRDMGIQFRDNRFESNNGNKWSLSEYAWAMPADDDWYRHLALMVHDDW